MTTMSDDIKNLFKKIEELSESNDQVVNLYDNFDIELSEHFVIETQIVGFEHDGVIVEADEATLEFLDLNGVLLESTDQSNSEVSPGDTIVITKHQDYGWFNRGDQLVVRNINSDGSLDVMLDTGEELGVPVMPGYYKVVNKELDEAEYQGRKVTLNKPMAGDVKKSKVYVKDPKTGNVKKINFGDKEMRIKKSNPDRRKSFRARHKCDTAKDKTTARYWSCRAW
jgi:hypothetical protein